MEGYLYDTSKLIDVYKKGQQPQGCTTILNLIEFPKVIELELKVLYPSKTDYNTALKLSLELQSRGKPIPATDLIIASVAMNNNLKLVTKDKHFINIKEVRPELDLHID